MHDVSRAFTLVSPTMALLIYFLIKDVIDLGDLVLNILFIGIVFAGFGIPWQHRVWVQTQNPAQLRVRRMLYAVYLAVIILAVATPILSLTTAYILKIEAPQYISDAFVGTMNRTPAVSGAYTLANVHFTESKSTESYVAVFRQDEENIAPARAVLREVLGEIDSGVRATAAWYSLLAATLLMIALGAAETLAGPGMTGGNAAPLEDSSTLSSASPT